MTRTLRTAALATTAALAALALGAPAAHAQFRPGLAGRPVIYNRPFVAPRAYPGHYNTGFLPGAPVIPMTNPYRINPNYLLTPELSLRQAAYNTAVAGRALSTIPPWAYGYNPYPSPVINYGSTYLSSYNPYLPYSASTGVYNPYLPYSASAGVYNPYAYGYGVSGAVNPYYAQ